MNVFICPRCQQQCIRETHTGDFQHDCHGDAVLANEDVIIMGAWTDYTGSDLAVRNALMQGVENNLFGTRAWWEGAKDFTRTDRGFPARVFRTRRHIESIEDDFFTDKANQKQVKNPETWPK